MASNFAAGRSVYIFLCLIVVCTLFLAPTLPVPLSCSKVQAAGASVTVDPTIQYQTLEGWGTSLAWFAHVLGGAPDGTRTNLANLLFDPNTGLGLNIVRYNIGGGENPRYLPLNQTFLEYRARVPGYKPSSRAAYDWTADPEQRWFLQAAISRGANHVELFSNSPPYWMTNSGSASGSPDGTSDNLNPDYYDAFADYLATVAQHFQNDLGIQIRTVEPVNEPSASWWKFGNRQEGAHFDRSTQNTIVKKLGAALASKGVNARVSASDESVIDDAYLSTFAYDSTALSYMSQINTHTYGGSNRTGVMVKADDLGKTLWMSETGEGDATGLAMSQEIIKDMKQMQPTAWAYWQAIDDASGPGWGMIYSDLNNPDYSYTVNQKYYVMKNYSKFIRPGYKFIHNNLGGHFKTGHSWTSQNRPPRGSVRDWWRFTS
jgi:O-glycosyl hydrolase